MSFPRLRTKPQPLKGYKALLRVYVDLSGTGIWEIPEPHFRSAGKCRSYESLDLPSWLIERFNYWTSWRDSNGPQRNTDGCYDTDGYDTGLYYGYAMSLATDLKRMLGDDYYIEFAGREIHDDRDFLAERFKRKHEPSA